MKCFWKGLWTLSAFSLLSPPQGNLKPCLQDADPHTETRSAAILEPERRTGSCLSPRRAPELRGALGEHSSGPAPASLHSELSRGAFFQACPSLHAALLGSIPSALPQPKTGSPGTHSCSSLSLHLLLLTRSISQALPFLCSPALVRSIAPIALGTRGNP